MKKWYQSKTLWLNILGILSILAQSFFGFIVPVEIQEMLLALINIILRLITNKEIEK
jgi:uncharacterized membrane protein